MNKVRYIVFTVHKDPRIHRYMLDVAARHGFRFDTVQMPLNVMDAHYRSFEKEVLPEFARQGIGVLSMKSTGNGIIVSELYTGDRYLQRCEVCVSSTQQTSCLPA